MELVVLIPALLIFLFFLYKLTGDDHVFIRKNISIEHMYDIAFNTIWVSLLVSRIVFFLFDKQISGNFFVAFFTTWGGLSLSGAIASAIAFLYFLGKYKKIPLGRLYDFLALSLLCGLPLGYLSIAFLRWQQKMMIPYLICSVIYIIAAVLFKRFLYPRLLNRTLKEGSITIYFFFLFSVVSLGTSLVNWGKPFVSFITASNIMYLGILLLAIILLIKQEKNKLRRKSS